MRRLAPWVVVWLVMTGPVGRPAAAQAPVIGDIDLYGLRKIAPERILSALKIHAGDRLPPSKGDMEDRLGEISGVVLARVEVVCCEGPRTTLFIGIEERGAPHAAFRSEPAAHAALPPELIGVYGQFLAAVGRAAARGNSNEDLSAGHSLMDDPEAWAFQQRFLELAPPRLNILRDVLRNSSEPDQRAVAAALIGYGPKKAALVDDLQYAIQDPDEAVRANAMRSLTAVAVLASKQPNLDLKISPTWLVELLHSIVLSDRVESVKALLAITEGSGAAAALDLVRERALAPVMEMARWKTPRYALPPFLLAGRLAGLSYVDTLQRWADGDRETVLARALATGRKKPGGALQ